MKIPNWCVPVLLRLLSLSGLASAAGGDKALTIGFALSSSNPAAATFPTAAQPQPRLQGLSLDLDFFLQVANHELKVPIMPLHLLGKKSWNVYNVANIEKVKRDEAIAKAEEDAEEQRMQERDAERRLQILRGEIPTPLAIEQAPLEQITSEKREARDHGSGREPKRRKRAGESDTDFEMRLAADQRSSADANKQIVLRKESNAPLVDHRGHIDLFPQAIEKHPEVEKEAARKKKEYEDQYTMRFSNAAGLREELSAAPWYSKSGSSKATVEEDIPGKNAFGRVDPRRKERDAARIVSNDPLAMMKAGAKQVRQVKMEREAWLKDKEREICELEEAETRKSRKRKHRDDESDLEDFRLDEDRSKRNRERSRERESSRKHRHHDGSREERHHHKESRRSSHREDGRERRRHNHSHSHSQRHRE